MYFLIAFVFFVAAIIFFGITSRWRQADFDSPVDSNEPPEDAGWFRKNFTALGFTKTELREEGGLMVMALVLVGMLWPAVLLGIMAYLFSQAILLVIRFITAVEIK